MTALEWVGAIVAVLVAFGIASAGLGYLWGAIWSHIDGVLWRMAEKRIRERGIHMKHQHWWWEKPEQAAVWMACAEHMAEGNYPEIGAVRDQTYPRMLREVLNLRPTPNGGSNER